MQYSFTTPKKKYELLDQINNLTEKLNALETPSKAKYKLTQSLNGKHLFHQLMDNGRDYYRKIKMEETIKQNRINALIKQDLSATFQNFPTFEEQKYNPDSIADVIQFAMI